MAGLTELAEWERELLCGEPEVKLLCGELIVFTRHPQRGVVLRGAIRAVGVVPAEFQPAVRWRITGPKRADLGEHVGDFVDALARLLDATPQADEIDDNPSNEE